MKKIITKFIFICVFSLMSVMSVTASEQEISDGVVEGEIENNSIIATGTCGQSTTWMLDSNGLLTITGEGLIDSQQRGYNGYQDQITSLVIEEGITEIDSYAFSDYSNLTGELSLPSTLQKIGASAFSGCINLTGDLIIPNGVKAIGSSAFEDCSGFDGGLVLPKENLNYISSYAFENCSGLTGDLIIPDSVTYIGMNAFRNCSGFDGILKLSSSLEKIDWYAFQKCTNLKGDLIIPEGVTTIGEGAFSYCSGFDGKLIIPDSVTSIGTEAFINCSGLTGDLILPDNLTQILSHTFYGCSGFDGKLVLPSNLQSIYNSAFEGCNNLCGELILPESLNDLKRSAFEDCSGFTGELVIPDEITVIHYDCFKNCSGLSGLRLPDNLETISSEAFCSCTGFTGSLTIPESVTYIASYAFYNCSGFEGTLNIPENTRTIGDMALYMQNVSEIVVWNSSVKFNEGCPFYNEVTLVSYPGSTTIEYAKEWGINYVIMCDHTDTSVIAMKNPTCTTPGLTEGVECSACHKVMVPQEIIPATGHTWSEWETVVKATYTSVGKEKRTCSSCDMCEERDIPIVEIESFSIDKREVTLLPGEEISLHVICTPIEPADNEVVWSSNDESIATVDANGKVRAIGKGTAIIKAKINYSSRTCLINVSGPIPDAPLNLNAALFGGHDDVKLTWSASEHATGYYVYYKKSTEYEWSSAKLTEETYYVFKDLADNVIYDFKVIAYNQIGDDYYYDSDNVSEMSLMTKKNIAAPSKVTAVLYGHDDVKISWTKSSGADGYFVYYKKSTSSSYTYLADTTGLYVKKSGLTDGVKYTFKVVPYYKNGAMWVESYYTKTASIYTLKELAAPTISKYSATKIKVNWQNINGETGYQISQSTSKTGTSIISTYATTSGASKTFTVTRNKTYYYKVRAYKTVGSTKIYGPWSAVKAYNLRYVAAQSTVKASLYGYDDVKITWTKVTGANTYDVYYKKSSASSYTKLGSTTGISYKIANLADGVTYNFKVVPRYKSSGKVLASGTGKIVSITTLKTLSAPTVAKYSSKKVKVSWKNIAGETGYQISQSTSKTGTSIVSTYATTSGTSKTIAATKGKIYYYKVRAYKTVGSTKIYGPWSDVKAYKL